MIGGTVKVNTAGQPMHIGPSRRLREWLLKLLAGKSMVILNAKITSNSNLSIDALASDDGFVSGCRFETPDARVYIGGCRVKEGDIP